MNIAIIESGTVVNTIVCESVELAESITGLTAVEYTNENPAGIGWTYSNVTNKFIPIKPYNSWILNEEINQWEAPTQYPNDEKEYVWNESTISWDEVVPE